MDMAGGASTNKNAQLDELRQKLAHKERLAPAAKTGPRMEWRFQAYRQLLQRLGHGDGMAEVMEVANRDFLDAARASGDPSNYLAARSRVQNIVVYELDMENLPTRAATLFIVGAYQQLDGFLKDLVAEVGSICDRPTRTRNSGEGSTDWALDVLPGGRLKNTKRIWVERYHVLEYYRGIRNAFMHSSKSASSLDCAHRKAVEHRPLFEADFKLMAPNAPDRLTLDDFLLFTRVIKYAATDLCRIATPTDDDIASHANRQFQSHRSFHGLTLDATRAGFKKVSTIAAFGYAAASGHGGPLPVDVEDDPLLERFIIAQPANLASEERALTDWQATVPTEGTAELTAILKAQYTPSATDTPETRVLRYRMAAITRAAIEGRGAAAPKPPTTTRPVERSAAACMIRSQELAKIWRAGESTALYADPELAGAVDLFVLATRRAGPLPEGQTTPELAALHGELATLIETGNRPILADARFPRVARPTIALEDERDR